MKDRLDAPSPRAARIRSAALGAVVLSLLAIGCWPGVAASAATSDVALQVSFDADAGVRLRGDHFVAPTRAAASDANAAIERHDVVRVERLFDEPEESLDATRRRLLAEGKRDVPDLNRYFRIVAADRAERDRLLAALDALPVVDDVIPEPRPAPPPAGDYTPLQGYGFAAPGGIAVNAVAGLAGGTGENAKIVDIEYAWNPAHEDLAKAVGGLIPNGVPQDPFNDTNHGTAVLGELVGTANGFGVTGLAAGGDIGMVNANSTAATGGYSVANAMNVARLNLTPGDVILVEQQTYGIPNSGIDQDSFVPTEYLSAVYDAIRLATLAGIIVVETAGNGGVNLDAPAYGAPFPGGKPDSGAIMAGAGSANASGVCAVTPPPRSRMYFSTYGARLDLQGWGECVATTGYGSHFNGGPNALYTAAFNGTSSAGPIVAGAAALYSSMFQAATGGRAPNPLAVRSRLVATGTPQAAGDTTHVGPLPNVAAAVTGFDFTPPTVAVTGGPSGPTSDPTPTFEFAASEPPSTVECRLGAAAFSACSSPFTTPPLAEGAATFEVRATDVALNPGAATTRAFIVDTVAPTVSISDGPSGRTTTATPTFTFAASEAGATFACRAGTPLVPGTFAACASPYTTGALADGASFFEVQATDAAGNTGAASSRAFTVAVPPPTPPPPPPPPPPAAPIFGPGTRMTVRVPASGTVALPRPRITCPTRPPNCAVTLTARLFSGARTRVGTASRTVAAGRSATVSFRLNASARTRLRRRGQYKVNVAITASHAAAETRRTVQATLKRKR